jgi:catechol 2,3-dioxygenase-like lactoylglutathione lyase family enzyme
MYQFLLAADFMVPDPDMTKETFCNGLGLPDQRDTWRQDLPNHCYLTWHLRVHKSLAVAPTRIMCQGYKEVPEPSDPLFGPYLHFLDEVQGEFRPMKSHAMVLISDRLAELEEKLQRRKLPFRIAPIAEGLAFDRIWVGVTGSDPYYEPSVDGGLFIEVMEPGPLQLPEDTWKVPPPTPTDPAPGEYARVASRGYLVEDLDEVLRLLSMNLDWEPDGPTEDVPEEGYRRARMHLSLPHGSAVELIQPTKFDCPAGRYLATWGPGIYHTRLAVAGLDARADDLSSRGTRFTEMPESRVVNGRRLSVNPDDVGGALFELVELES